MFKLKLGFKQIFKDKIIVAMVFVTIAYAFYGSLDLISEYKTIFAEGYLITGAVSSAYFYVVAFLFWSGYVTYSFSANRLKELAFDLRKQRNNMHIVALIIVNILLVTVYTIINVVINSKYSNADGMFTIYTIRQFVLSLLLPATFMIILGCVIGRINNVKLMIVTFLAVAFVTSPMATNLYEDFFDVTLRTVILNFDIIQNGTYGMSSLHVITDYGYKWVKMIGLIALALLPFYMSYFKKKNVMVVVMLVIIFVGAEVFYYMPDSRTRENMVLNTEMYYYQDENREFLEEEADFKVTDYKMNLKFGRVLKAQCTMILDKCESRDYKFTLYHTLKISRVIDEMGNKLPFEQSGDYFVVHHNGSKEIKVEYEGAIDWYSASNRCVYLPEDFCYYPISGYKLVANPYNGGVLTKVSNDYKANFVVNIGNEGEFYSNLLVEEDGSYAGNVTGPLFVKGEVAERKIDGITYICPKYPCFGEYYTDESLFKLSKSLKEIEDTYGYCVTDKYVYLLDYGAGVPYGTGYHFGDNYIDLATANPDVIVRRFKEAKGYDINN